ncbi:MAG TPA: lactonase family protein [Anaerolineales bacterium]|nr:lactonase family protein [Anaerolineales bacterium]
MSSQSSENGKGLRVFVGTYTEPEQSASEGVYVYHMDPSSGKLTYDTVIQDLINPSYLAVHPQTGNLYVVHEKGTFQGNHGGGVIALSVHADPGRISLLNKQSSGGEDPCYISIERTGHYALVANYISGCVAMLPIYPDGMLGAPSSICQHAGSSIHPERQDSPYAHCILPDPSNQFAVALDLGIDKLRIYRMDLDAGQLQEHGDVPVAPGSGPRHLAFHPNGRYAYVVCELNSTLIGFGYIAESGTFEEIQSVRTLPQGYEGQNLPADIHITPNGKFLYVSNRKHESIAIFSIDADTGQLTVHDHIPSGGREPRGFAIDPGGKYMLVANQNSNNIVTFLIDPAKGQLSRTGDEVEVPMPVCIKFA